MGLLINADELKIKLFNNSMRAQRDYCKNNNKLSFYCLQLCENSAL